MPTNLEFQAKISKEGMARLSYHISTGTAHEQAEVSNFTTTPDTTTHRHPLMTVQPHENPTDIASTMTFQPQRHVLEGTIDGYTECLDQAAPVLQMFRMLPAAGRPLVQILDGNIQTDTFVDPYASGCQMDLSEEFEDSMKVDDEYPAILDNSTPRQHQTGLMNTRPDGGADGFSANNEGTDESEMATGFTNREIAWLNERVSQFDGFGTILDISFRWFEVGCGFYQQFPGHRHSKAELYSKWVHMVSDRTKPTI